MLLLLICKIKGRSFGEGVEFSDDFDFTKSGIFLSQENNNNYPKLFDFKNEPTYSESMKRVFEEDVSEPIYFFAEIPEKNSDKEQSNSQLYYTFPSKKLFDALNFMPNSQSVLPDQSDSNTGTIYETLEEGKRMIYRSPLENNSPNENSLKISDVLNPPPLNENTNSYVSWPQSEKKEHSNGNPLRTLLGVPLHPRILIKRNAMMIKRALYPYYHK